MESRNIIIFVYFKAAYVGYDFRTKFIENFVEKRGYEIIILKHSQNFYAVIEENLDKIAILYIHTTIYRIAGFDWFRNSKYDTFDKFLQFLQELKSHDIIIQPQIEMREIFDTKIYNKIFIDHYPAFGLPKTKVLVFKNTIMDNMIPKIVKKTNKMLKTFDNVVIKKGYASVSRGNLYVTGETDLKDELQKFKNVDSTDYHKYDSDYFEHGSPRVIVVQPFNEIIYKRENEFRLHFINNKYMGYVCHGADWNVEPPIFYHSMLYDKTDKNHKHLLNIALQVKEFINEHVPHPIIFRVDMSYSTNPNCQDEHSVFIQNEQRRYYVNEIELTPTLYFDTYIKTKNTRPFTIGKCTKITKDRKIYQRKILSNLFGALIELRESII